MPDKEKVIKALELEIRHDGTWDCIGECPYYGHTDYNCYTQVAMDAVELLKESRQTEWERDTAFEQLRQIGKSCGEKMDDIVELQKKHEPHVLTLPEIESSEVVWFEARTSLYIEPMLTRGKTFGEKSAPWFQYGRDWRCWSARPTDEQRKAVKWDEG